MDSAVFKELKAGGRLQLMKEKRGLLMDLDAMLNELKVDLAQVSSSIDSESAVKWLKPLRSITFAKDALRRTGTGEITVQELQDDLTKVKEWAKLGETTNSQKRSLLSGMTALEHMKDMAGIDSKGLAVSDFLYCCGIPGIAINVYRSQSAIVNPWNLVVRHVSSDWIDSASAMCMLHAGIQWRDGEAHNAEDVLVVMDPQEDKAINLYTSLQLSKAYTSIVCTRNPDLYNRQQRIALLGISFVRAVEQLYHHEPTPDSTVSQFAVQKLPLVENLFHIIFTIRKFKSYSETWAHFLQHLLEPNPSKYLTESEDDGVQSVAQILVAIGCIACFDEGEGILHASNEPKLSEAALAILGESVSRGCRIKIKSADAINPTKYREFIREALSISTETNEEGRPDTPATLTWIHSGKKYSGRFFKSEKLRTNASPQAVAACLAFSRWCAEYWKDVNDSVENVLKDSDAKTRLFKSVLEAAEADGGMHDFLVLYSEDSAQVASDGVTMASKDLLQIALYVQGLRFHDSKTRRTGLLSLKDPFKVIHEIMEEEKVEIYKEWLAVKQRELLAMGRAEAKKLKTDLLLRQQKLFLDVHSGSQMPRIFSKTEVIELNKHRPANDQLEWLPESGLLKHHCSNPACPEYLVNQATDNDRIFNRRNGLFRHLKWYFQPKKQMISNYHILLKHFLRQHQHRVPKDRLFLAICESFKSNPSTSEVARRMGDDKLIALVETSLVGVL
ncbi:hypothetical protein BCR33DRAFT_848053 [Rhizoclosmatium globosum]|uniref:Uncharacterized protein n=1 Tax=Rhizoclosmatium globosum TaxID=329046 RepID=A0A1Y2CP10_9FUNG|nr:hypothetical protein BCR33DRAFT_848053 [Rhizoclosmatium globosum]|eukprot:ORY48697.1 hypothetical protein BCR33DRAFT_848053 [Rhizoclosmatium globosum]